MPLWGFEPTFPASERRYTLALDRSATGIGQTNLCREINVTTELESRLSADAMIMLAVALRPV
jgi:hypothetical protein